MRKTALQLDNPSFAPGKRTIPAPISVLGGRRVCPVALSLLLLVTAAGTARAQNFVIRADSLALVELYRTTDGAGWKNKSNWLVGPVDTWWGITVTEDRVTEVVLTDNDLKGEIPSALGALTGLVILDLGSNALYGWVPSSLGELERLQVLNLENNLFLTGALPLSLTNLRDVHTFIVANTRLCYSSEIGSWIGGIATGTWPDCYSTNNAPELIRSLPDTTIWVGESFVFDMDARDTGGNGLRYIIAPALPPGAELDPVSGEFSWTPSPGQSCHYHITSRVTDGLDEASAHATISVVSADTLNNYCAQPGIALLGPGDIAVVGMNVMYDPFAFNPKVSEFAFVALVDLPRGTQISFTNSGWKSDRSLMRERGDLIFTAPQDISRGSVVSLQYRFERTQDQILAYQGSRGAPRFLYGLNNHRSAEWQPEASREWESAIPERLVDGLTAVAIEECRASVYVGVTVGTQLELLRAISDQSNWLCAYSPPHDLNLSFTVTDTEKRPEFTHVFSDASLVIGETFSFDFDATNPNNRVLEYAISPTFPDGVDFNQISGQVSWTPTCGQHGEFDHSITVSDGWRSTLADFRITVEDVPLEFSRAFADSTIVAGVPFALDLGTNSSEGLTYSILQNLPSGAGLDPETGRLNWTPTEAQLGPHVLLASASDGCNMLHFYFRIIVKSGISAPVFTSGTDHRIVEEGETVTIVFAAESPRGEQVTISIRENELWSQCDDLCLSWSPETNSLTWQAERPGIFSLLVRATDESGESTDRRVFIAQTGPTFENVGSLLNLRAFVSHSGQPHRTLGFEGAREKLFQEIDVDSDGGVRGYFSDEAWTPPQWTGPGEIMFPSGFVAHHLWPESLGAGESPQRGDLYNLVLARTDIDVVRRDLPFTEIPDDQTLLWFREDETRNEAPTSNAGEYSEWSESGFEPRESLKGDIARSLLYFFTTYNSISDQNFFALQRQTLFDWAIRDPLSTEELLRALRIEAVQRNLNPFLLDPSLPTRLWGVSTDLEAPAELPRMTRLLGNYPNPFRESTTLVFELRKSSQLTLDFYDILGRRIASRDLGLKIPGRHHIEWLPKQIAPGLYFCVIRGNPSAARLLLVKQ